MSEPRAAGQLSWRFVDDPAQLGGEVEALMKEDVLGLDTETFWEVSSKRSRLSLVQIAPPSGDVVVVDALATGVEPLRPLLESSEVKLVAHNARFDEGVLRGAGVESRGLLDTLQMARFALSLTSYSLASVTEHLFGLPLDKTLQTSNWRRRPLSRSQLEYAAKDARIVLDVYEELRRRLAEEGRLELALRVSELRPAAPRTGKPRQKRAPLPPLDLTPEEKRVVAGLKKWRMECARTRRVPVYMVCQDRTLEHLARERPKSLEALANIYGLGESKITNFGEEILRALKETKE
ncbi:MAG TPA: HRDC domain-containing protein [Pyrinomonadaceae bacterium]|nr:HRDC domain-containing protein [Pyrinomonadaceae bacterium]